MSKAAKWTILAVLVATLAVMAFALGVTFERNQDSDRSEASAVEGAPDFDVLYEIYGLLERNYVDESLIDGETLSRAAIDGLVKSLADTGTYYVDPQTYGVSIMPSGTFEGIGANVTERDSQIVILSPIKGSPAEEAGIRAGDVILEVDGESTEGWNIEEAVSKIRGAKGTEVRLKVHHTDGSDEELTLTRDEIKVESVTREVPVGDFVDSNGDEVTDLAYIQVREFTALTVSQLKPEVEEVAAGDYDGLILDLRSNPGGLLDTVVKVADMFLDNGTILVEVDREQEERVYSAESGGEATEIPIVVLVNGFSASGSEVVAAALHDNDRATLIGEKTFGKGTVNRAEKLSNDRGALFVTVARWLTPKRIGIDKVGITPDIEVALTDEDVDAQHDSQLLRAIDFLRGQE